MEQPDLLTVSYAWCDNCGKMRQFLNGRCGMRAMHLKTCACGRPATGGLCSECENAEVTR